MELKDAFFEFAPVYYWTKLFGLSPFSFQISNGKRTYEQTKWNISYSLFILVSHDFLLIYLMDEISMILDDVSLMLNASKKIYHCVFCLYVIMNNLIMFQLIYWHDIIPKSFDILDEIDGILESYDRTRNKNEGRTFTYSLTGITVIYVISECISSFTKYGSVASQMVFLPIVIYSSCSYILMTLCIMHSKRFRQINSYLAKYSKFNHGNTPKVSHIFKSDIFSANDMKNISRIHSKLCYSMRELNHFFSIHILVIATMYFFWITLHAFVIAEFILSLTMYKTITLVYNFCWMVEALAEYMVFVWSCWQVGYHVIFIIMLLQQKPKINAKIKKQLFFRRTELRNT